MSTTVHVTCSGLRLTEGQVKAILCRMFDVIAAPRRSVFGGVSEQKSCSRAASPRRQNPLPALGRHART